VRRDETRQTHVIVNIYPKKGIPPGIPYGKKEEEEEEERRSNKTENENKQKKPPKRKDILHSIISIIRLDSIRFDSIPFVFVYFQSRSKILQFQFAKRGGSINSIRWAVRVRDFVDSFHADFFLFGLGLEGRVGVQWIKLGWDI
jgi:hypothetical protein